MSNLTPLVSSLLVKVHSVTPIHKHAHTPDRLDTFLQEAYRINAHITSLLAYLRQIRQPYLATTTLPQNRSHLTYKTGSSSLQLTDPQRTEIDSQTSTLLHDLSNNISALTAAENLRVQTETALFERRFGKNRANASALWRWAAGDDDETSNDASLAKSPEQIDAEGRAYGIKVCRESILWFLGWRLQEAADVQRGMIEVRAAREREKEKSVLWKLGTNSRASQGGGGGGGGGAGGQIPRRTAGDAGGHRPNGEQPKDGNGRHWNSSLEEESSRVTDDELPADLRQLFEDENSSLLQHYESTLSKVQVAEKSLLEISSLQQTMVSHLSTQGEMIEQLVQDAANTEENVRRGNRELKRAGERWGKGLARGVFWGTVGICGFSIVWDLIF